jgi:hypothetical protein
MAAHAIREMTNALPSVIDVPVKASKSRLGDYVERVIVAWKKARAGECFVDGKWKGTIDQALEKALNVVQEMITWHEENRPKRAAVAKGFFRKSDPSPLEIPANLEKDRAREWTLLHDFFVRMAHGAKTEEIDFIARLEQLDNLLLSSLSREPAADFSTIDAILAEEE